MSEKHSDKEAKESAKAEKAEKAEKPSSPKRDSKETKAAKADKAAAPKAKSSGKKEGPKRTPLMERTFFAKKGQIPQGWRLVDATGVPLGRLSSLIATILMGKDKPTFTRSEDMSDHVVVINAEKIVLTGKKWDAKTYNYHTQFPGGIKTFTARELLEKHPKRLVEWAVYGMLPKGHMGRKWYKKLWVYPGGEHPHAAQKPQPVKLQNLGFHGRA